MKLHHASPWLWFTRLYLAENKSIALQPSGAKSHSRQVYVVEFTRISCPVTPVDLPVQHNDKPKEMWSLKRKSSRFNGSLLLVHVVPWLGNYMSPLNIERNPLGLWNVKYAFSAGSVDCIYILITGSPGMYPVQHLKSTAQNWVWLGKPSIYSISEL